MAAAIKKPTPPKKLGRPRKEPTPEQRKQVMSMAAYGIPQEDIARAIGMSKKTMCLYCQEELATGATKANAKVAESLYQQAVKGNVTAAIFWAKTRMGWKETNVTEHTGKDGGAIEIEDVRSRIEGQLNRLVESKQHKQLDETLH